MEIRNHSQNDLVEIESLFLSVFRESAGEQEGRLVSNLVGKLITETDANDLYGFVALDAEQIIASLFFSRLTCHDQIESFILSPLAVHTDFQRKGIGQRLINHGLASLKQAGVEVVITYGDPAFYSKVGFRPVSDQVIRPPFALSQPQGWLGLSLQGSRIEEMAGNCSCVAALNDPVYW